MTIIPSLFILAALFTSVHSQEVGKYTLDDANLGLALTLFVNEDETVNWMYECKFGGFTRPYLVGPYRLADGATSSQFIIDYEWTILPVLIRQHCPFIDGIVPTDFSIIRFLNEDIVTTTIRNESVRFSRVDNSYITPYLGRPSPSSNYEFLYLVFGHEELRAVVWVTCGDSPSDGAWLSFRLDRDESNSRRVEYVMSPLYQKAFEDFQDEVHIACRLSLSSDDLHRVIFASPRTMFINFFGRRVSLTTT